MSKNLSSQIKSLISDTKKTQKKSSTTTKKNSKNAAFKLAITFCLLIGAIIGYVALSFVCKNDKFEIIGTKNITLAVGDSYVDAGASVTAFGKNANDKINVEIFENNTSIGGLENIDTSRETTYQIVYTVSSIRYRNIQLIRLIQVTAELAPEADAVVEE